MYTFTSLGQEVNVRISPYLVLVTLTDVPLENNFEICFVGRYFWQLCETSKFRIVRDEPGANSTCFACKID